MSGAWCKESVEEYYGKVLQKTEDLRTSACTSCKAPPAHIKRVLKLVPAEVKDRFYGCGNPIPEGIEGLHVLDLGSGSGRDCYAAALLAGPTGSVTGVDMTAEQLEVAKSNVESFRAANPTAAPMRFLHGYIEDIIAAGVERESVDLVISNCVVNLSQNKRAVLQGVYDVLKNGGEFYFSDMYADRRVPSHLKANKSLHGEGLSGALYEGDFLSLARSVGFKDPREVTRKSITVYDPELASLVGNIKYMSITYRLFKLPSMDDRCEDYGQVAIYLGTLLGSELGYELDNHHVFETNRPVLVCGNTADMLGASWLKRHFKVIGTKDTHFGVFACNTAPRAPSGGSSDSCGSAGGCC